MSMRSRRSCQSVIAKTRESKAVLFFRHTSLDRKTESKKPARMLGIKMRVEMIFFAD